MYSSFLKKTTSPVLSLYTKTANLFILEQSSILEILWDTKKKKKSQRHTFHHKHKLLEIPGY